MKIIILSAQNNLENLLNQIFKDFDISTQDKIIDAEVIIDSRDKHQVTINFRGCDEKYLLTKPIPVLTLKNILRKYIETINHTELKSGELYIYPSKRICIYQKREILLSAKEVEIIEFLYKNANRFVEKKEMLKSIWGYSNEVQTHTLETHIYKLRAKFPPEFNLIVSNEKGYALLK